MTGRVLTVRSVGAGVLAAHRDGAHGSVVGTFRHGCYVQVEGATYAVVGPAVEPGPLHLVVAEQPQGATQGVTVWRDRDRLRSTGWIIDLGSAPVYAPPLPGRPDVLAAAPALGRVLDGLEPPADLAQVWPAVRAAVASGDLVGCRTLLEGRGIGLTPTGDDVLAGLLLIRAWCGADPQRLLDAADGAATTNLSRAFLAWAARGQSLLPVHELMTTTEPARFDRLVETIWAIGGSSGPALLWGLGLAAAAELSVGPPLSPARAGAVRPA